MTAISDIIFNIFASVAIVGAGGAIIAILLVGGIASLLTSAISPSLFILSMIGCLSLGKIVLDITKSMWREIKEDIEEIKGRANK